ncbi:MAG: hypothetical protein AMS24_05305 [Chlamydiae bacterium SM23_39]|nr:MAG: hypothetical protein AMS24_05305 [Chlamydiae bacterium SM23_39]
MKIRIILFFTAILTFAYAQKNENYSINFNDIPIKEYIKFVSKIYQTNFTFEEKDLNFKISIISNGTVSKEDVMTTLIQILKINGFSLLEENNSLVIHKNPAIKQIPPIVESLNKDIPISTMVFKIKNSNIQSIKTILDTMISPDASIQIAEDTNQLIITDNTQNIEKMKKLIEIIDSPINPLEIEKYKAKNKEVEDLINLTTKIITPLVQKTPYILVPQNITNSIFIVSTPKLIEKTLSIFTNLDSKDLSGLKKFLKPENIFIYQPKYQSNEGIRKALTEIASILENMGYKEIDLINIIDSIKWIKETNSFLFTGTQNEITQLKKILKQIDISTKVISFFTYQPKKKRLNDLAFSLKELAENLKDSKIADNNLIHTLKNVRVIENSNSLLFTGNKNSFKKIEAILSSIDTEKETHLTSLGKITFFIYKIKNIPYENILNALKNTAENLQKNKIPETSLINSINSAKYIKETNSILFTGSTQALTQIKELLPSFDIDLSKYKSLSPNTIFYIYNPKNKSLEDLSKSLKDISKNLEAAKLVDPTFLSTIESMKLVESTHSLLFTGNENSIKKTEQLLIQLDTPYEEESRTTYFLYKLKNTPGNTIEEDLDNFAEKLKSQKIKNPELLKVIENAKWIEETNSIMLTGNPQSIEEAKLIITEYDVPREAQLIAHDNFLVYTPKYASPNYLKNSLLETASNLEKAKLLDPNLINSINNVKIIESTNSLAFTGTKKSIEKIKDLLSKIDTKEAKEKIAEEAKTYLIYKIQKADPDYLIKSIESVSKDLKITGASEKDFIKALDSMKYKKETNTLLFTGTSKALLKIKTLLKKFDVPTDLEKIPSQYFLYKPKYLSGPSLQKILYDFEDHLKKTGIDNPDLFNAINNIKWDKNTKSLIISGSPRAIAEIKQLLERFDSLKEEPDITKDIIEPIDEISFLVYKLQYHKGDEIQTALKQIAQELTQNQSSIKKNLLNAINSIQWIQITNSLLCSGDKATLKKLKELIKNLDVPLKQVFIEVLVIETSFTNLFNFGLDWGGKFKYKDEFITGTSNSPFNKKNQLTPFMENLNDVEHPLQKNILPFSTGFDLGIIGDILLHKGKSFLSLGSFLRAIQSDEETTIITTPKIIAQDNKTATIFFGQNIPYVGSQTVFEGSSKTDTINLEYRDIGMSLSLTPVLGNSDTVTLDLNLERTIESPKPSEPAEGVQGIVTSKTTMKTTVHIPNKNFLVLSGMVTESKVKAKAGIPCLGGLPLIGAAFANNTRGEDKKNIVIFMRPHIINSYLDMKDVTKSQENFFRENSGSPILEKEFDEAVEFMKSYEDE